MTIACLGWGSLIWNPDTLPLAGGWEADGPELPIEFARQSDNGRVTLVVTPNATNVPVLWAPLAVDNMEQAITRLAEREKIRDKYIDQNIGHWSGNSVSARSETQVIGAWAASKDFEAVVWASLRPRFGADYRVPSCAEVVSYLRSLEGERRTIAEKYIRKTPLQVMTAYRQVIQAELGWTYLFD